MNLVVWNIRKFTQSKFEDTIYRHTTKWSTKSKRIDLTAVQRLNYMETIFKGVITPVDVIAVLEVMASPDTALGAPLSTDESSGLLTLLNFVKRWTGNDDWRLVPAIKCNPSKEVTDISVAPETVGVLYNAAKFAFNGPDVYGNPLLGDEYPPPWNELSITGAPGWDHVQFNAAQVQFSSSDGQPLSFPANYHRRPFMVDFVEKTGASAGRKIRCAFIHTSPHTIKKGEEGYELRMDLGNGKSRAPTTQTLAVREYANIRELVDPQFNDNDITLIAGDFNVNEYSTEVAEYSYKPLQDKGFRRIVSNFSTNSTLYQTVEDAWPQNRIGKNAYMRKAFLDNCLIKSKSSNIFATGNPIDLVYPSPFFYRRTTQSSLDDIVNRSGTPKPTFRQWENFWHVNNTSDHLPIEITVI